MSSKSIMIMTGVLVAVGVAGALVMCRKDGAREAMSRQWTRLRHRSNTASTPDGPASRTAA